jgi:hypothetical protein
MKIIEKMGDKNTSDLEEFFSKISALVPIMIGVMAKISHDIMLKKRHSFWQWVGIIGVSIFCGYMVSIFCMGHGYEKQAHILVPLCTLFGEKIMIYVTDNWSRIVDLFVGIIKMKK